jgi:hypothetical protein
MSKFYPLNKNAAAAKRKRTSIHQLKHIYDNFIEVSSASTSISGLPDILHLLENTTTAIVLDPVLVNHEFASFLFCSVTRILSKINVSSTKLIRSIKKCLKDIAKSGKYLHDKYNVKYFAK